MTSERRTSIDFSPLRAGLEQPLQLISDPERRRELEAYIGAALPHVERAAFDVLSQAVTEFNDANPDSQARLEYGDGGLHLTLAPAREAAEPETSFEDGDFDRVTLRLPKELKKLIDHAAGRHGMSANNWYVRELSRVIRRSIRDSIREEVREAHHGYRGRRGHRRHFEDEGPE
jgi:predicted HicB family RNase H-like nuclease